MLWLTHRHSAGEGTVGFKPGTASFRFLSLSNRRNTAQLLRDERTEDCIS